MKRFIIYSCLALAMGIQSFAQENVAQQKRSLVNVPTAGVLQKGQYDVGMRLFDNGGVLTSIGVGITDRFMFGIAFGGENIIGSGKVKFNPLPGVEARYRMIDESTPGPAVTVGFDNQGFGPFIKKVGVDSTTQKVNRYTQKSRGLFVVASKNYAFMGNLGFHGGISWSVTEKKDKDDGPAFFIGMDKSLNDELSFVGEYDLALNDNKGLIGNKRGYLNMGVKFNFGNRVMIDFIMTDMLNNSRSFGKFSRELRLSLVTTF
ncbi:hypothetical protein JNM05_14405 [bacterium]|nr:hypothetical protein [bacterium]